MTTETATLVLSGVLGLAVGSFLNVCIYRLPRGESLVHPASRCPSCGRPLRWYDNIPVVSWVWLGGKCGQCHAPISTRYPMVELLTAAIIVGTVMVTPPGPLLASRLVFACALVVLFAIDLEHQILPNLITLPGIAIGWLFSFFAPPGWQASLIGIALGFGIIYGLIETYYFFRGQQGMGLGDAKMLAMIGAFLGWQGVILTSVLASFSGAALGVVLIASGRAGLSSKLPFGTFLAVAAVVTMLFGQSILEWYWLFTNWWVPLVLGPA